MPFRDVGSSTRWGAPTVAVIGNVTVPCAGSLVVITKLQSGGASDVGENLTTKPKQKSGLMVNGSAPGLGLTSVNPAQFGPVRAALLTTRSHLPVSQSCTVTDFESPSQS